MLIGRLSNASTFCSFATKESDEGKPNNKTTVLINLNFERTSNSTPKCLTSKINLIFIDVRNKSFKSKDNKKIKCDIKKQKTNSKNKVNLINIKNANNNNDKINISPVNKISVIPTPGIINESGNKNNSFKNGEKIIKSKFVNKEKKLKIETYSQSLNLSCMKTLPPKLPEVLNFENDLKHNNKWTKSNNTYGHLSKGKIPNIFFGHLMVDCNLKNNRYLKSSCTQRNKNKLLTVLYFKPL